MNNETKTAKAPQKTNALKRVGPIHVIGSETVKGLFLRLSAQQESSSLEFLAQRVAEDKKLEEYLFEVIHADPASIDTPSELAGAIAFFEKHPNWWARHLEAPIEQLTEVMRNYAGDGLSGEVFELQLGAAKGAYGFAKDLVLSIPDLISLVYQMATDSKVRSRLLSKAKKVSILYLKLQFGPPSMKVEALREIKEIAQEIWNGLYAELSADWEEAEATGRETELVAKWATRGLLEIATLVIGAVKGPQAAKQISKLSSLKAVSGARPQARKILNKAKRVLPKVRAMEEGSRLRWASRKLSRYHKRRAYRLLGKEGELLLKTAAPEIRERIEYFIHLMVNSSTNRKGRTGRMLSSGKRFFQRHPGVAEEYVRKSISILERIRNGEGIDVYTAVRHEFVKSTIENKMKPPKWIQVQKEIGKGNRFESGRYAGAEDPFVAVRELEFNAVEVPAGYTIIKSTFKPQYGLNADFYVVPSIRRPGGISIVDKEILNRRNFRNIKTMTPAEVGKLPHGS